MSAITGWFEGLVLSGGLANLAIAVLVVEAAILLAIRPRIGAVTGSLLVTLANGIALMMIVRAALLGRPAREIAILFTLALALHMLDVWVRLRSRP